MAFYTQEQSQCKAGWHLQTTADPAGSRCAHWPGAATDRLAGPAEGSVPQSSLHTGEKDFQGLNRSRDVVNDII